MLLDTNAFLFFLRGDARISKPLQATIANPAAPLKLSAASFWEMTIKHGKGKLPLPKPFSTDPQSAIDNWCSRAGIQMLDIVPAHISRAMKLDFANTDPFDRIIAATALVEGIELVTSDRLFASCRGLKVIAI